MTAYDYSDEARKEVADGALADLDEKLESMDKALGRLAQRLAPIIRNYDTEESQVSPKIEPASEIRRRIERLADQRRSVDVLTERIDI